MLKEIFKKTITQVYKYDRPRRWDTEINYLLLYNDLEDGALEEALNIQDTYEFEGKEKIFFLPGCTVPRFKFKKLKEEFGLQVVRNIENADVIITAEKSINSMMIDRWFLNVSMEYARIVDVSLSEYDSEEYPTLYFEDRGRKADDFLGEDADQDSILYRVIDEKSMDILDYLMTNQSKIVKEGGINAKLNTTIMTDDMYEEATKMLESEDKANHTLAMELMANCNYNESAYNLVTLYQRFWCKISNNKTYDHVNFKAFLEYFNIRRGSPISDSEILAVFEERGIKMTQKQFSKLWSSTIRSLKNTADDLEKLAEVTIKPKQNVLALIQNDKNSNG